MKKFAYFILFLFLPVLSLFISSCEEDDPEPAKPCLYKSFDSDLESPNVTNVGFVDYVYNVEGILQTLERKNPNSTVKYAFEYNSNGLVSKQTITNSTNASRIGRYYVWKYNNTVLTEVEIFNSTNQKQVSYFFTFDAQGRLTKITSDDPSEFVYTWEYSGNSRNPSKKALNFILDVEAGGAKPGDLIPQEYYEYTYDDKPNPETLLQGFPITPDRLELYQRSIILEPIPANNIVSQKVYFFEYDDVNDKFNFPLDATYQTTYTYNKKGYPISSATTFSNAGGFSYEDIRSYGYDDCEWLPLKSLSTSIFDLLSNEKILSIHHLPIVAGMFRCAIVWAKSWQQRCEF